jgi:hypothetical protein
MRLLKSGNLLVLFFMMLCLQAKSQEVINNVTMQKAGNNLYRIQYSLNATPDFNIEKIVLKIYRRRNGNIQEIFSLPMAMPVTQNQGQPYSFDWKATNELVQAGDDLQAKIVLSLKASQAKQQVNRIPVADAGNFTELELPMTTPITLNGSKSHDEDGKLVFIEWKQIGGPTNLNILQRDSLIAHADGEFKPGTYAFQLTIKDNIGSVAVSRTIVTVKEHTYWSTEPPKNNTPPKTNVLPSKQPVKKQTPLKGGPANTAFNLLLPGVGHYFVSGDYNGENKKAGSFIVTAVYAGSIGGAFYFNGKSNGDYKKYNELASYREYQRDANGLITGIRGANETDANKYFNSAKRAHRNSLICLGVGGGVLVGDLIYTFLKGSRNKKEWKSENTSFKPKLIFSSNGNVTTAGVQFKF